MNGGYRRRGRGRDLFPLAMAGGVLLMLMVLGGIVVWGLWPSLAGGRTDDADRDRGTVPRAVQAEPAEAESAAQPAEIRSPVAAPIAESDTVRASEPSAGVAEAPREAVEEEPPSRRVEEAADPQRVQEAAAPRRVEAESTPAPEPSGSSAAPGSLAARQANERGLALFQRGHFADATEEFELAVRSAPSNAEYRNNYGWALMQAGRLAPAEEQLRTVVRMSPRRAIGYANLAEVRLARGDTADGIELYRRFLELNQDRERERIARDRLRRLGASVR